MELSKNEAADLNYGRAHLAVMRLPLAGPICASVHGAVEMTMRPPFRDPVCETDHNWYDGMADPGRQSEGPTGVEIINQPRHWFYPTSRNQVTIYGCRALSYKEI